MPVEGEGAFFGAGDEVEIGGESVEACGLACHRGQDVGGGLQDAVEHRLQVALEGGDGMAELV